MCGDCDCEDFDITSCETWELLDELKSRGMAVNCIVLNGEIVYTADNLQEVSILEDFLETLK